MQNKEASRSDLASVGDSPLILDFDMYPVALFEADACEEVTGDLVG